MCQGLELDRIGLVSSAEWESAQWKVVTKTEGELTDDSFDFQKR